MAEAYKDLKKGGEQFRTYKKFYIGGQKKKLPLVNNSIEANELYLNIKRKNKNAMIKSLKKSPKTDSASQRQMKAFQNRASVNLYESALKRDKDLLIKHDTGARKITGFRFLPTKSEKKEALWQVIKGKLKDKGA